MRLDRLLLERGLAPTRSKAQALIMAGKVLVEGKRADKAGSTFPVDADIEIKAPPSLYVSRGGDKLAWSLEKLPPLTIEGRICVDIGASTGGFTDLLLSRGAALVYAVDVGRALLHEKLREDERVVVMEGVNARYLTSEHFPQKPSLATVDVSFISLRLILPPLVDILPPGGHVLALIKPQFEVGRKKVSHGGVVRKGQFVAEALLLVLGFACERGLAPQAVVTCPLPGPKGNREFFALLQVGGEGMSAEEISSTVEEVVSEAFSEQVWGESMRKKSH